MAKMNELNDTINRLSAMDEEIAKTLKELKFALAEAQEWAASVGYKEDDVNDIIKSVRKNKK